MFNIMTATDFYKADHRRQYPDNTTRVYSNWTARGSRVAGTTHVNLFGLQYFLERYMVRGMNDSFFDVPLDMVLHDYRRRMDGALGPNDIGVEHIKALHELGYVPLRFCSLPEGIAVPLRVPMFTVENTHDDFAWLVNYFETLLSATVWLPCTSATSAARLRKLFEKWALITGTDHQFVGIQGHDFSMRGMAGLEAAAMSGAGHLLSFVGTDTIPALEFIEEYYGVDDDHIGGSVFATEHSVMCAGGELNEMDTFERLMDLYPNGIVSVVSDTWDLWEVITKILPALHKQIMDRDGKLVIRPDSGDPVDIICGDPNAPEGSPAAKGVVELLWNEFGGTLTDSGHKLLDSHIGAIYGDAITYERAEAICRRLDEKGFTTQNVVLGIGSYTYQYVTRDTHHFAMKATWVEVDGKGRDIFKDPVTDSGEKRSAKGRLAVKLVDGEYTLINQATPEEEAASELKCVWENGDFKKYYSLSELRRNVAGVK